MGKPRIEELKIWFENADLPETFKFEEGGEVTDMPKFLNSHFTLLTSEHARGRRVYMPYYNRLYQMYKKLK